MSEKDVSLPANRAFVIQLQASSGASEVGHRGRVEHLASGRAMHFADEDELWAFVDSVLATVRNRANQKDKREIGMKIPSATSPPSFGSASLCSINSVPKNANPKPSALKKHHESILFHPATAAHGPTFARPSPPVSVICVRY